MDRELIIWLMRFATGAGVAELEYSEGVERLKIVGGRTLPPTAEVTARSAPPRAEAAVPPAPTKRHRIVAGATGLFYSAPSPGSKPFVAVGDLVNEGDTIGILEAMKMLTPIESDQAGRVVEIVAVDGATISTGSPLLVLELEQ